MTPQQIIDAWNAQADEANQWGALGEDEKLMWAYKQAIAEAALARQDVQDEIDRGAKTLRETYLAQPEPEPVAWWHDMGDVVDLNVSGRGTPLYTAPPQREWQGMTDEERQECLYSDPIFGMAASTFARAIEAKLKEKNS